MKKIFFLLLVALHTTLILAQPKIGSLTLVPKIGATLSRPTGNSEVAYFACDFVGNKTPESHPLLTCFSCDYDPTRKFGVVLGADLQYQVVKNFAWVAGINYAQLNSSIELGGPVEGFQLSELTNHFNYIQAPVSAKFYLHKSLAIQFGMQFNWLLKSEVDLDCDFYGTRINKDSKYFHAVINNDEYGVMVGVPHMRDVKNFGISLPMGISYEYCNLIAEANYNIAISKSATAKYGFDGSRDYRNSTFMFTLGYRFSLLSK